MLRVADLHAGYGPVQVLEGMSFEVGAREIVVILGANGAGKTTTMRAVSGMISWRGQIEFDGVSLAKASADKVVRHGIAHVPQGRGTFAELTVEENLDVGGITRRDAAIGEDKDRWFSTFPRLAERRRQQAGSLSGGEQQMLAIARAMMSRPKLLLCDEPSMGLAPIVTAELFRILGRLNADLGTAMLIVEQNANLALTVADRGYVLETGRIVASGTAAQLQSDDAVRRAYLGF
jgi:branched-chain amino acid transport system ATP-binding protein